MASASAPRAASDVIVVGGGVIGLALAEELARRGRRVEIYERQRPGGEASWAAGGMIAAEYEFETAGPFQQLAFDSRALWPEYAARLRSEYGADVRLRTEGALATAFDAAGLARLHQRLDARTFGGRVEWLDAKAAREQEPALAPSVAGAAWLRDDLVCENRALLFALLRAARKRNVTLHAETPTAIRFEDGRVRGIVAGGRAIDAELVINAAGAWASSIASRVPGHPSVHPVRGQMLGFISQPADALRHVVRWDGGYAIPRSEGRIVVGSTMEPEAGFTKSVTPEATGRMTNAFRAALPGLAAEPRHAWSGLRPASEDGLPILGALDGVPGYLLATGHFRNGILLTPVTAALVADLAEGKRVDPPSVGHSASQRAPDSSLASGSLIDSFSPSRPALAARTSIVVNGAARALRPGTTVRGLLSELALERPGVAVAVNEEVVRRGDWDRTILTGNDRVEIIHAVGGG